METGDLIEQATARARELLKSGDDVDRKKGLELAVNLVCLASRDMDTITIGAVIRATERFNGGETNVKRVVKESIDEAMIKTGLSIKKGDRKIVTKSMMATFSKPS